jgi:hypothetical protein
VTQLCTGSAGGSGVQTGDVLRGVFVSTDGGQELLVDTQDLTAAELQAAVARSEASAGADISVIVERITPAMEGSAFHSVRDTSSQYVKQHRSRVYLSGHTWAFDSMLPR